MLLRRLLFAVSFAFSGFIATTSSTFAAFDPNRDEVMGIMAAIVGGLLALLTLIYAVKWYFGWDRQDPHSQDLQDYLTSHH